MKVKDLVLAKCINNKDNWNEKIYSELEVGKYYIVEEIIIGQSYSSVKINNTGYNSIMFEYYDDHLNELDIYHSKYSPYYKGGKNEKNTTYIIDTNNANNITSKNIFKERM